MHVDSPLQPHQTLQWAISTTQLQFVPPPHPTYPAPQMLLQQLPRLQSAWCGRTTPLIAPSQYRQVAACSTAAGSQHPGAAAAQTTNQQQGRQQRQQQLQQQWFEQSAVYYSNYPLNRAAEQRRDAAQLERWFNAPNTRVTPVQGSRVLLTPATTTTTSSSSGSSRGAPAKYQPVWVSPAAELGTALGGDASDSTVPPLFLGLDPSSGSPHFAVQVSRQAGEQLAAAHAASWVSARVAGPDLSRSDAALLAVASGLAQWNLDSQYHGASGANTLPQDGGFSRRCSSSGRSVYPRIDPAIITLVTCGPDYCLLGRKADWPTGRYSTLAGFLEVGETLEQALCREVLEESGVAADLASVRYVTSQPWPFPRSLMVGFYAEAPAAAAATATAAAGPAAAAAAGAAGAGQGAAGAMEWLSHEGRMAAMDTGLSSAEVADAVAGLRLQQPTPQEDEMQDVRWFHREWLHKALQDGQAAAPSGFFIPGEYSLAYRLITTWLADGGSSRSGNNGSSSSNGSSSAWVGDQVLQVDIDSGAFKYVLMRLTDTRDSSRSRLLVRGSCAAAYHNHILQHTKGQLQRLSPEGHLQLQVLGGGRIEHYPEQPVLSVYGYSAAFGPAVHEVTAGLLKKWNPFSTISWSYEGY